MCLFSGRYEEDLIEHRRAILQHWANKLCRHPVLSQSEVWRHFVSCTDEAKWKKGKRQAERDEYVGGNFFNCVSVPPVPTEAANVLAKSTQLKRQLTPIAKLLGSAKWSSLPVVREVWKRVAGTCTSEWSRPRSG
jgi:hypothetical protein